MTPPPCPAVQLTAPVAESVRLARNTFRIRLDCPELARLIRPGQFVMLRVPGSTDPLLGRPFALYDTALDTNGEPVAIDVVYLVVGKVTGLLARLNAGAVVEAWGPLGNGFADLDGRGHVAQRVYTVGRLDESSEGLLLLTNDGDLAFRLMHPRFGVEKTYLVQVAGDPTPEQLKQLLQGVFLAEGRVKARRVKRLKKQKGSTWLKIVLAEGKNREIRRMLARLGHKVLTLKRVAIGPVKLDRLPRGKSRRLSLPELKALRLAVQRRQRPKPQP